MKTHVKSIIVVLFVLWGAQVSRGEAWVTKMFAETKHDFGTVARGADTVYRFQVKNIYKQDVELVSVSSSCGCTSPTIDKKVLKTGEVGYVTASFNTRTFTGVHGATLTVTVRWNDKGLLRTAETQLRVDGNIRGDIVFQPGAVGFTAVDQGAVAEQHVEVTYAGRSNWKVTDVRGASDSIEVELTEKKRYSNHVAYDLLVRLKGTAAAGYLNEQLVLVTNDEENPRVPIYVTGKVVPSISVAPESLMLGSVNQGEQVSKKFMVRGKTPFRITSIQCDDQNCFAFKTDDKASERHFVEIHFDAKKAAGDVKQPILISTDLGEKFRATLTAYATVVPTENGPKAPEPAAVQPAAAQPTATQPAPNAGTSAGSGSGVKPSGVAAQ
ncbi:MAG: DUF1573 domain-containing protein [Pirellulales bacterium]|nr:DUF1573 domain-containing protein [Pirellulales bacterium]